MTSGGRRLHDVEAMRTGSVHGRRRMARGLLLLALAAGLGGCSDQKAKFTGNWKANCEDYFGVLIKPAGVGFYAVTFCGLSGCLEPGAWTADTRIEDDPMYQVVSPKEIRIRRSDGGYFTYIKCSADPFWRAES